MKLRGTYIDLQDLVHAQKQRVKIEVVNCGAVNPRRHFLLDLQTNPWSVHTFHARQEGGDEVWNMQFMDIKSIIFLWTMEGTCQQHQTGWLRKKWGILTLFHLIRDGDQGSLHWLAFFIGTVEGKRRCTPHQCVALKKDASVVITAAERDYSSSLYWSITLKSPLHFTFFLSIKYHCFLIFNLS